MLKLSSVTKTYGRRENAFNALSDINIEFEPGTTTAIIGKSGSGKSTLLHILTGLDHPSKGNVTDDDKSIYTELDTDIWRGKSIGIIFQQFFLQPNNSVVENVALPLKIQGKSKRSRLAKARIALESVGLADRATNRANDLSGGQKQRIAIARAILKDAPILVLDEATSALDTESEKLVQEALDRLMEGRTSFVIAHRLSTIQRADCILVLEHGELVEQGAHDALLQQGGLYAQLYNLQFRDQAAK